MWLIFSFSTHPTNFQKAVGMILISEYVGPTHTLISLCSFFTVCMSLGPPNRYSYPNDVLKYCQHTPLELEVFSEFIDPDHFDVNQFSEILC